LEEDLEEELEKEWRKSRKLHTFDNPKALSSLAQGASKSPSRSEAWPMHKTRPPRSRLSRALRCPGSLPVTGGKRRWRRPRRHRRSARSTGWASQLDPSVTILCALTRRLLKNRNPHKPPGWTEKEFGSVTLMRIGFFPIKHSTHTVGRWLLTNRECHKTQNEKVRS